MKRVPPGRRGRGGCVAALGIVLLLHLAPPAAGQVVFTLPQAVAFALEHNPQVAANRAAVKAAEAQVRAAQAGLAPTLSLSAGGSLGGAGGSVSTSGQVSTGVTYLLYDGGVRQVQVRQAQAQLEAARQALAAALAEVALQTVQAYMAVIVAQQVVALREQAVR